MNRNGNKRRNICHDLSRECDLQKAIKVLQKQGGEDKKAIKRYDTEYAAFGIASRNQHYIDRSHRAHFHIMPANMVIKAYNKCRS